ncbi:MAG: peptidylprolyl isomerase [Pedobacter sp.]|nr:MAG: peptidylprolyl isomerase [Pedobacter sp.]
MRKILFLFLICIAVLVSETKAQNNAADKFVKIETNLGVMIFALSAQTPIHTTNFIKLARKGYFNAYNFNRVIKGFVIQGGETDSAYAAMEKEGVILKRLAPEFNTQLFHQKGALAAGRDDRKDKTSFTGQFYVVDGKRYTDTQLDMYEKRIGNGFQFSADARKLYKEVGGTPNLDQNYTVFGQLVKGWEVLESIASAKTDKTDKPLSLISIRISVLTKKEIKSLLVKP